MINATQYLKDSGLYSSDRIKNFLALVRVQYFIGGDNKVVTKCGRYGGGTFFTDDLFAVFVAWLERKPLPILNRKEHEVSDFVTAYFPSATRQHHAYGFIYDWYVPPLGLYIEFNEQGHRTTQGKANDLAKRNALLFDEHLFVIQEKQVMRDLAALAREYLSS